MSAETAAAAAPESAQLAVPPGDRTAATGSVGGSSAAERAALRRPRVLLGVTGSVATVKWAELVVALSAFADVAVVATKDARHMQAISQGYGPDAWAALHALAPPVRVHTDEDEWASYTSVHADPVLHIELGKWADLLLIAPLSANTLAKLATGLADNLLTCVARAWDFAAVRDGRKALLLAPAMNTQMWVHPFTAPQLASLQGLGATVIAPVEKRLACGDVGTGAMAAVTDIAAAARAALTQAGFSTGLALDARAAGGDGVA
jgi:phosphopantothenoylcysteine decarboxylase